MIKTAQIEGYKNFEDGDECGFVGPRPPDKPSDPLHDAIQIVDRQRWLIGRLDELLEEPLTGRVIQALRKMRLAQIRNAERCEALIQELAHEHSSSVLKDRSGLDRRLPVNRRWES